VYIFDRTPAVKPETPPIMKYILSFLLSFAVAGALQAQPVAATHLGRNAQPEKPFVTLTGQPRLYVDSLKFISGKKHDKIWAGGKEYDLKEVAGYSDGRYTFIKYEGDFLKRNYEGKINSYRVFKEVSASNISVPSNDRFRSPSTRSGFVPNSDNFRSSSPRTVLKFILEDSATGRLAEMDYKTLRDWIPRNSPASASLDKYKRVRTRNVLIMTGGLATIIGGFVLLGTSVMSDGASSDALATAGGVLCAGGVVGVVWGIGGNVFNRKRLREAVAEYNGVDAYDYDGDAEWEKTYE